MPKPPTRGEAATPVQPRATSSARTTRASVAGTKTTQRGEHPVETNAKKLAAEGLSPLQEIAQAITGILTQEKTQPRVMEILEGILKFIKETENAEKEKGLSVKATELSSMHKSIKADLSSVYSSLHKRMDEILDTASESLSVADKVLKGVDAINSSTKNLSGEVGKVSDAANKIADTTATYRDGVLKNQTQSLRSNVNPIVLSDLDRKARQILVEIGDTEGNDVLTKSLGEIKLKAEDILNSMEDKDKPGNIRIEAVLKTRIKAIILTMNSKESVAWLKEPPNDETFLTLFAGNAHFSYRKYNIVVPSVPITFDPMSRVQIEEIEEVNGLQDFTIAKAKWIKPIGRRSPGQTHAYAILRTTSAQAANLLIRDRLIIHGVKVKPIKQKQEPTQCMKCRWWGHFARDCTSEVDICGTCGENHRTRSCTNKGKTYCIACKDSMHASWDRDCPEAVRKRAACDERNPENEMPFFPTEQDWTLMTKPIRIPLADRFPQKYAVNSLPYTSKGKYNDTPRPPEGTNPMQDPQRHRRKGSNKSKRRENANDTPIERARERDIPLLTTLPEHHSDLAEQNRQRLPRENIDIPAPSQC
ncbi:hypothetical protein BC827DRAFT_1321218 [Russula dissimulans]|nr:hypothetical protein BC827DRAFT_1321218 [Russula dissimulans]